MARKRQIDPDFFTNEKLAALGPYAMLVFEGLWTLADREGRLDDVVMLIHGSTIPYFKDQDCNKILDDLSREHFIVRYQNGDRRYIFIPAFKKRQPVHPNEKPSVRPAPTEHDLSWNCTTKAKPKSRNNHDKAAISSDILKPLSVPSVPSVPSGTNTPAPTGADIPFLEIVSDLNTRTGKNFKPDSRMVTRNVSARWKEGYRLDDFRHVNTVKVDEWLGTDMAKHLNPDTLYGNNFEKYRNQTPSGPPLSRDQEEFQRSIDVGNRAVERTKRELEETFGTGSGVGG